MNNTQYLIILITAVVCFCIYVVVDIARLRKREFELRSRPIKGYRENGYFPTRAQLQEEIRTRLEGGDGA